MPLLVSRVREHVVPGGVVHVRELFVLQGLNSLIFHGDDMARVVLRERDKILGDVEERRLLDPVHALRRVTIGLLRAGNAQPFVTRKGEKKILQNPDRARTFPSTSQPEHANALRDRNVLSRVWRKDQDGSRAGRWAMKWKHSGSIRFFRTSARRSSLVRAFL